MKHLLRDLAKIGVGLFAADLFSVLWFSAAGFFPLTILGVTWTSTAVLPIAIFDIAVILLLIHYGWNTRAPIKSPTERGLLVVVGIIFAIVALVHFIRLTLGLQLALGSFEVPVWLSWLGFFVTAYLALSSFHFAFRPRAKK